MRVVSSLCAASIAATLLCTSPVSAATVTEDEVSASSARKAGDVNGDGKVTDADATLIQKYLAGKAKLNNTAKSVADVNYDGKIDINDMTRIQRFVLKKVAFLEPFRLATVSDSGKKSYFTTGVTRYQNDSSVKIAVDCASDWTFTSDQSWLKCKREGNYLVLNFGKYYIFSRDRKATITLTTKTAGKKLIKFIFTQKNSNSKQLKASAKYGTVIYKSREYIVRVPQCGMTYINRVKKEEQMHTISLSKMDFNALEFLVGLDLGSSGGDADLGPAINMLAVPFAIAGAASSAVSRNDIKFHFDTNGKAFGKDAPDDDRIVEITRHSSELIKLYSKYSYEYGVKETSGVYELRHKNPIFAAIREDKIEKYVRSKVASGKIHTTIGSYFDTHLRLSPSHAIDKDLASYIWFDKNGNVMETPFFDAWDSVSYGYKNPLEAYVPLIEYDGYKISKPTKATPALANIVKTFLKNNKK